MKILILIRTCPKDDFISFRTMHQWKAAGVKGDYMFFAEEGEYKWIKDEKIHYRPKCDNFLGKDGVYAALEGFKGIDFEGYDKIIFCDADLTIYKSPFDVEFDFGGVQDCDNPRHFSGQCLIFSKWVFDKMRYYHDYPGLITFFVDRLMSVADDTIFSYVCTSYVGGHHLNGYWQHEKMHHLEPKT